MEIPFAKLIDAPELLTEARELGKLDAPAILRLRKRWPADLVGQAVDLLKARQKAQAKFDDLADAMLADAVGVEQASSLDVARHKARRFAEAEVPSVVDLCCGIGGDTMALAEITNVLAIDRDFQRAWMARHNVQQLTGRRIPTAAADVTTLNLQQLNAHGGAFHLDPERRQHGRRAHRYADLEPGPAFIDHLLETCEAGAIKLGPGVDLDELPPGEVELIQRGSTLVQAVLWVGRLARGENGSRTATKLMREEATGVSFAGQHGLSIPIDQPRRYLLAVEPAIERAGLMGALCRSVRAGAIHPALGLLTSKALIESPWLTPFELLETMPWRSGKVKAWLRAHDAGIIEVK
ncbi:MAG: hypothetical protein WD079_03220, partial [Phycisphaeraceae bacterium]